MIEFIVTVYVVTIVAGLALQAAGVHRRTFLYQREQRKQTRYTESLRSLVYM